MKKKKTNKVIKAFKNSKPLRYLAILLLVGIVGYTGAYYYNSVVLPNEFKSNTINVTIEENFDGEFGTKEVSFVNKESTTTEYNTDVYLRINYNEYWLDDDGNYLNNLVDGENAVEKTWTDDFKNYFVDGEDGWFYYTKVLKAGESVKVLESIILLNESYDGMHYNLDFNFEAIQADSATASKVWGKTVTTSDDTLTWN